MSKKYFLKKHKWHNYLNNQINDETITTNDQTQSGAGSNNQSIESTEASSNQNNSSGMVIKKCSSKYYDKFSYLSEQFKVFFKYNTSDYIDANKKLEQFFEKIINEIVKSYEDNDSIRIIIFHPSLDAYQPLSIPFIAVKDLTPDLLLNLFSSVAQSKRELKIDAELIMRVEVIKYNAGGGLENIQLISKKKNKSIWHIINSDNFCLLRCVIIGNYDLNKNKKVKNFLKPHNKEFNSLVNFYVKKLNLPDRKLGFDFIKILEQEFDVQITVFDDNFRQRGNKPIYIGESNRRFIYLYYIKTDSGGHYHYIHSVKSLLNCSYYCHFCKKKFEQRYKHNCNYICKSCRTYDCKIGIGEFNNDWGNFSNKKSSYCDVCLIEVKSQECLNIHKKFICSKYEKCNNCYENKGRFHVCKQDHKYCNNCNLEVNFDHRCYILKEEIKKSKIIGFLFFDYESYLNEKNEHVSILIIVHKYDLNNNLISKHFFDSNDEFCFFLFNQKNYLAFAHNMKGYDGIFVMNYILNNPTPFTPQMKTVLVGHKFLRIEYKNVVILDSFSFLPMALSCFSETFNIETKKGYFPHLFSKLENLNYIGSYPDKKFYGYEFLNINQKHKFDSWYDSVKENVFNYKNDLYDYCDADVDLLAKGILKFREIILSTVQIEPFFNCSTIAGLAHLIYRQKYMPINKIGIIPEIGYNPKENTSRKAIIWLKYIEKSKNITLITSSTGFEHKIDRYKVDGFHQPTNTAYEFLGCVFHGCNNCFSLYSFNKLLQKFNYEINEKDKIRREYLKSKVNLIEIKECEWNKLVKENKDIQNFIKETKIRPAINPREALFGGRTNAFKLYHKISNDEKIKYIDINSLYPSVQFYCKYPVDHPEIITNNFQKIENYFGLAKIDILPPQNLFIPVLPLKINGKLVFTLCYTCAKEHNENCNHTINERLLHGTWCTIEIQIALKYGYKIIYIYEVWHFKNYSVFNENSGGIFNEYIKTFLKIKQESSGFPEQVKSNNEKNEYIQNYSLQEGVKLDINNIQKNKGLRAVAKLLLNSLWGRFGMQTNKIKSKLFTETSDWNKFLSDSNFLISHLNIVNNDLLQVFYTEKKELHDNSQRNNVIIAAFVTAHARIKLFSEMIKLDSRLLYVDTDSLIYISKPNEYDPPLSDNLGEFSSELESDEYIIEFVSTGAKCRAHETNKGRRETIIKGFTLNFNTSLIVNLKTMKEMVQIDRNKKVSVKQQQILRNFDDMFLYSKETFKEYKLVYDKRIIKNNVKHENEMFSTIPFGFIEN